jgi:hypothetical protein
MEFPAEDNNRHVGIAEAADGTRLEIRMICPEDEEIPISYWAMGEKAIANVRRIRRGEFEVPGVGIAKLKMQMREPELINDVGGWMIGIVPKIHSNNTSNVRPTLSHVWAKSRRWIPGGEDARLILRFRSEDDARRYLRDKAELLEQIRP